MVVVIDTSIWIDFLRGNEDRVGAWLAKDAIVQHPYVTAEIGMGSFRSVADRAKTLDFLASFAQADVPDSLALDRFVEERGLFGSGIGFPDASLLLATLSIANASLWTRDKSLLKQASRLDVPLVT